MINLTEKRSNNKGYCPNEKSKFARNFCQTKIKSIFETMLNESSNLDVAFFKMNILLYQTFMIRCEKDSHLKDDSKVIELNEIFDFFLDYKDFEYSKEEVFIILTESIHEEHLDLMLNI